MLCVFFNSSRRHSCILALQKVNISQASSPCKSRGILEKPKNESSRQAGPSCASSGCHVETIYDGDLGADSRGLSFVRLTFDTEKTGDCQASYSRREEVPGITHVIHYLFDIEETCRPDRKPQS